MVTLHRNYFHYAELPLSLRVLYTGTLLVLGIGYLFAMIHIFASHAGRDGDPGLSVNDLVIAYSGTQQASALQAKLDGSMGNRLKPDEKAAIIAWIHDGATEAEYDKTVAPILKKRCVSCHHARGHRKDLSSFAAVSELTETDQGVDLFTLVRVSHIHLFGITFIFFIMGLIFSHAYMRPVWLKATVVAVPFAFLVLDVASWYLTKIHPGFAWVVMISGGLMGLSFAIQWAVSLFQIWFFRLPHGAARPRDADTRPIP